MSFDLPSAIPDSTTAVDALLARYARTGFVGQAELVCALVAVHQHALGLKRRLTMLERRALTSGISGRIRPADGLYGVIDPDFDDEATGGVDSARRTMPRAEQ